MIIEASNKKENSFTYFLEKSSALIHKLITGQGDAKTRLRDAEFDLAFLLSFDVPEHLEALRKTIFKSVSQKPTLKFKGKVYMTSFQNSISGIKNSTASKIIGDIYSLHLQVIWYKENKKRKYFFPKFR